MPDRLVVERMRGQVAQGGALDLRLAQQVEYGLQVGDVERGAGRGHDVVSSWFGWWDGSAESDEWDVCRVGLVVHEHGEVVRGVEVGVDREGGVERRPGGADVASAPVDPGDERPQAGGVLA